MASKKNKSSKNNNAKPPENPGMNPFRTRLHEIIFEADDFAGALFDVFLLVAIVASIVVVSLDTVPGVGRIAEASGGSLI